MPRGDRSLQRASTTNKSLRKALQLLSSFTEETPEWSVSALSRHLEMAKSTVSTMLATLATAGLVEQSPGTKRYHLGLRCLELGYLSSSRLVLRDYAFPQLEALLGDSNRIVYLAIPYTYDMLYIEALYPPRRKINYSAQGRRMPMHCTGIGKAALAFMPGSFIEEFLANATLRRYTPNTFTEPSALRTELRRTRERGYAVDREEQEEGIQCVAAPIRSGAGRVVAAISVSGSSQEVTTARFPELGEKVAEAARDISRKLATAGY
ncbi:MAG: IclR family transcriptional regulator [Trueperaceae bacterium]|nr:MAG: IclR family transcriptional regulator [Trueperaceae bacterium]